MAGGAGRGRTAGHAPEAVVGERSGYQPWTNACAIEVTTVAVTCCDARPIASAQNVISWSIRMQPRPE